MKPDFNFLPTDAVRHRDLEDPEFKAIYETFDTGRITLEPAFKSGDHDEGADRSVFFQELVRSGAVQVRFPSDKPNLMVATLVPLIWTSLTRLIPFVFGGPRAIVSTVGFESALELVSSAEFRQLGKRSWEIRAEHASALANLRNELEAVAAQD